MEITEMMEIKDAVNLAKAYYWERGEQELLQLSETEEMWIAFGGKKGMLKVGGSGITISKNTGEIKRFHLPSKENLEMLRNSQKVKIGDE